MHTPAYGNLLYHSMRAARRVGNKAFPTRLHTPMQRKYAYSIVKQGGTAAQIVPGKSRIEAFARDFSFAEHFIALKLERRQI